MQAAVSVFRDRTNLLACIPQWEELAAHAIEANPLYEHWMLLPALERLAPGEGFRCVLVWVEDASGARKLGALLPLHAPGWYKGLPIPVLRSFRHGGWSLCTPLVHADCARPCLQALLDWFSDEGEAALLELSHFPRDGALYLEMARLLHEREQMALATDRVMCARMRRQPGAGVLPPPTVGGPIVHRTMEPGEDAQPWIRAYVELGADERGVLLPALADAHRRGRLLMSGIDYGGRPIARSAAIVAGAAAFALPTACDAGYAQCAPQAMAEAQLARHFQRQPALRTLDSLAGAESGLLYRLWGGARLFQSVLIGDGSWGDVAVAVTSAHDDVALWTTP